MQANFLESNPMPVKAVLAMMGRIEEVLRLPMLPVKAETRAKLEKMATELGLLQVHASVSDLIMSELRSLITDLRSPLCASHNLIPGEHDAFALLPEF